MNLPPQAYVRKLIGDALGADPYVIVQNVYRDAWSNGKVVCYRYIAQTDYYTSLEDGARSGYTRMQLDVLCNLMVNADPANKGTAADAVDDMVSRMMYRIETFPFDDQPKSDDGRYTTRVHMISVDGVTANFTDGDTKIRFGITATAMASIYRTS
jgi:hypothetical protein